MGRDGNMPGDGITGVKMWEYPEQAVSSRNHQKSYNKAIKFLAIPRATHQHFIEVTSPHCNATVCFSSFPMPLFGNKNLAWKIPYLDWRNGILRWKASLPG